MVKFSFLYFISTMWHVNFRIMRLHTSGIQGASLNLICIISILIDAKKKSIITSMYMNALGTRIRSFVFDIYFLCLYDIKVK